MKRLLTAELVRTARGIPGDAVLIDGESVAAVGRAADLRSPDVIETSYPGAVIIPGLRDAHFHPVPYTAAISGTTLKTAADLADVADRLRAGAATLPPGAPLVALRLDDETLAEQRLPTRSDLDAAVADRPVLAHRYCGHIAVANSLALVAGGISRHTPNPPGGVIDRARTASRPVSCARPPSNSYPPPWPQPKRSAPTRSSTPCTAWPGSG